MMRCLGLLWIIGFMLFNAEVLRAQSEDMEIPNLEEIRTSVLNRNSSFYYPRLLSRYLEGDSTLTLEEFRYLYIGYTFQEGYNPYRVSPYSAKWKEGHTDPIDLNNEQCDSVITYASRAVADFPFDLREINMLIYAYKCKNDLAQVQRWETTLRNLIEAILSTGDGETPETAWFVISTSHEYDIVNRLGLEAEKYEFKEPQYDYLTVKENPFKIAGCYFNVGRMLEEYNRKYR